MELRNFPITDRGEKWHTCAKCGGSKYNRIEVRFESGSTEPTEDETITTASGDTGVVTDDDIDLQSGTWAGGDAKGVFVIKNATGVSADTDGRKWGVDGETASGSVGGSNMFTLDGAGLEKTYGVMYPQSHLGFYKGRWYCLEHLRALINRSNLDDSKVTVKETGRGKFP